MEINYNSATELDTLLKTEGLAMRKRYGQNFLTNPDARLRLADSLEAKAGDEVWEIGPGLGAMTRLLLDRGFRVKAFEVDPGFIRLLQKIFGKEAGFSLIEGDVLKTWPSQEPAPLLLGNLPYNIAAVLIGDLIEGQRFFRRMVVTVQKELAQRMTAAPGSENYSSFTVLCNSVYHAKKIMSIHRTSFYPQPHVDSCAVKLDHITEHKYPGLFYPLVRALFASRRKMIKNNLNDFLSAVLGDGIENKKIDEISAELLAMNRLTGMERAENLNLATFAGLAQTLEDMRLLG